MTITTVTTGNPWTLHRIRPDGKLEIPTAAHPEAIPGLVLDGVTDDGPAIQAALELVEDGVSGARLLIHGNAGQQCYINSTITISANGTKLAADVELLMGPDGRIRPWGTIDEQPTLNTAKPALTADAATGATVLHVDQIPAGWAAGIYVGLRGKRTASGAVPNEEIFHSYVASINTGALTITLVDPLPKTFEALWDTPWTNKLSQVTKVTSSKLTGTPDAGDVTINVVSSADFEVGDIVQIADDTHTLDDGGAVQDGNFAHKETAIIAEILSGTSLKLAAALSHTYDLAQDARIQKLNALRDVDLRDLRMSWAAQQTDSDHAIEIRYAYNTHVTGFDIVGGGDDGASWSGHAVRFTDSLACSASRGTITNPSVVTAGRGYGVSWYGSTRCWVDEVHVTGARHSYLWFNGASGCEAKNCISTDARISDYDWHGADCADNRTSNCTATGGTRNTVDSSVRTAWKWGNPSHRPGDRGNYATGCLVVSYAGVAIEGIPDCSENLWQGVVRGAQVGIKLGPLAVDDDELLSGFVVRDSEFYDVATPFDIDGGGDAIVRGLIVDNTRWHRSGPFEITGAPGARITKNQIIDPAMGSNYVLTATDCADILVKGNDFSLAPKGLAFASCPAFRCTQNDLHDLASSTVVFRDDGGNAGYLFRDNDYIGYTPTVSIGTASVGTLEYLRPSAGGGGTYPPAGGVPFADLDVSLQGVVSGAYVFPGGGIPYADLTSGVKASLDRADDAYVLPLGGIPDTDLATPGGGSEEFDTPANHTYSDWNFPVDLISVSAGTAPTAGSLQLMRVYPKTAGARTKVIMGVGTAGSGMTSAWVAVFDAATGTQLAVSADISSSLTSTGVKSLTVPSWTCAAGTDVYVGLLVVGGTPPAMHRASPSAPASNAGLNAAAGYRYMTNGTGLTAMPGSVTVSSGTSSSLTFWAAIE